MPIAAITLQCQIVAHQRHAKIGTVMGPHNRSDMTCCGVSGLACVLDNGAATTYTAVRGPSSRRRLWHGAGLTSRFGRQVHGERRSPGANAFAWTLGRGATGGGRTRGSGQGARRRPPERSCSPCGPRRTMSRHCLDARASVQAQAASQGVGEEGDRLFDRDREGEAWALRQARSVDRDDLPVGIEEGAP